MAYRHFIFDLYGTLADIRTDENDPALWENMARFLSFQGWIADAARLRREYVFFCRVAQQRREALNQRRGVQGPSEPDVADVWRMMLKRHNPSDEEITQICRLFRALSLKKLRLFPGAADVLRALRTHGRQVYLLTNAQAVFTMPELKMLGIDAAFDGLLLSSREGVKKPSPAFFALLSRRFRLDADACLMIGNDDRCDCRGAAAAGMNSLYIRTEQSPAPSGPLPSNCRRIRRITDVMRFL